MSGIPVLLQKYVMESEIADEHTAISISVCL
jgi:hypothetical protein